MTTMPRISALIFGLSLVAGCSKSSPDTAAPDDDETADRESAPMHAAAERSPTATGVYLDGALTAVCELPTSEDFFVYESDAPDAHASQLLDAVAGCVKTGPLAGRRLELVAHTERVADDGKPRGPTRADPVRAALTRAGVADGDIVTHAEAGDEDVPLDAMGWPTERRVDVRVATRHAK